MPSGATVTVSELGGASSVGGQGARRRWGRGSWRRASPRELTVVFPVAVGGSGRDRWGLDHLAHPGLIKRLIGGSYVNGPASKPSPKIYAMVHADQVEAYNLPAGCRCMHLHRDIAAGKPGAITKIGLGDLRGSRGTEGGRHESA
ncbi:MAG: hypothetical protein MZU79_08830 [Anaerotruncus sp.]|nr:hypothetical protein [Anaerotruncus sp.]